MNKKFLGLLFIFTGLAYGSLSFDTVYNHTLGWLLENGWLRPPVISKAEKTLLGRKATIYLYSIIFILIGFFLIFTD
jgi:hypothetical protein